MARWENNVFNDKITIRFEQSGCVLHSSKRFYFVIWLSGMSGVILIPKMLLNDESWFFFRPPNLLRISKLNKLKSFSSSEWRSCFFLLSRYFLSKFQADKMNPNLISKLNLKLHRKQKRTEQKMHVILFNYTAHFTPCVCINNVSPTIVRQTFTKINFISQMEKNHSPNVCARSVDYSQLNYTFRNFFFLIQLWLTRQGLAILPEESRHKNLIFVSHINRRAGCFACLM